MFIPTLGPKIELGPLPQAEREHAKTLQQVLWNMGHRCADLEAAFELFEHCLDYVKQHRNPVGAAQRDYWIREHWAHMAAREAAAIIYRFEEDMDAAGDNLARCPTLRSLVDIKQKRAATKAFSKHFSAWLLLRHSGQHHGKLYGTPEAIAEHAAPGLQFLINRIFDHGILTTYRGKHVAANFTKETILQLREVRDLYWGVFVPTTP
jgi:hypothetical protein